MTSAPTVYLFTDIADSTRLWERDPERMGAALAEHDALVAQAIADHHGRRVKGTGDGVHAVFQRPADALAATAQLLRAIDAAGQRSGWPLSVRCGVHQGVDQVRDGDFFGNAVNRAARLMAAAHGGQVLASAAVAHALADDAQALQRQGLALQPLGTLRLRGLAQPEAVHQLLAPGLRERFPALRSLQETPNNLAAELNAFIGREQALEQASRLLASGRLLTLLGMGGIGKSRLSVQMGAQRLPDFADGVWLVELAPWSDARLVPQAVANVLGLKDEGAEPLTDVLVRHLRDKQLLLILDNCEHLVDGCAALAKQLMQTCSGLKILATSRSALLVAGEQVFQVPTLDTPHPAQPGEPAAQAEPETLLRNEAVRLFVNRAVAVQPGFALTADNAAAVAGICHSLDGIPLAIELAAARVRVIMPQAIAERLGDRFKLLTSRDQTVLPRQRTLRALIDWSYDLLSEPERLLFNRMAVFAGGCTLEAVEGVCAGEGIEPDEVLDLLGSLVDKSLVLLELDRGRYRMLETVRHYALERLQQAGEESTVCARHLRWHVQLAEDARPQLEGEAQGAWLARLELERDNFLAAHRYSRHAPAGDMLGLRLMHALRLYWINRGKLGIGLDIAEELLSRRGLQARDEPRCMALFGAGQMSVWMGRHLRARRHLTECLDIAREQGNEAIVARVLQPLGILSWQLRDYAASRTLLDEALQRARRLDSSREIVSALIALAILDRLEHQLDAASQRLDEAVAIARALGDQLALGIGLLNLAMVRVEAQHCSASVAPLTEAVALAAATGSQSLVLGGLEACVGLATGGQRWADAAELLGMAETYRQGTGQARDHSDQVYLDRCVATAAEALGADAMARHQAMGSERPTTDALPWMSAWLEGLTAAE